jgi:hypothetical protein
MDFNAYLSIIFSAITSPNISSYFVAKQQGSLWIQGLRKKMIQAHSELCGGHFFPKTQ